MPERKDAIRLAKQLLDEANADPDDDLRMLSRQLLRHVEVVEQLKKDLTDSYDPTGDLIAANRDEILRKHEEAARRVRKQCEYVWGTLSQTQGAIPPIVLHDVRDHARLALDILQALNLFHPMADDWCGWPEGS